MPLPEEVQGFLREHVEAIEALEVMLLLQAQPSRAWTAIAAAHELRLHPHSVARRLDAFVDRQIAARTGEDGAVRYAARGDLGRAIARVAEVYRTQRNAVISFVLTSPSEKVQTFPERPPPHDR